MKARNKPTGAIEAMPFDVAVAAVEAGSHIIVNEDAEGNPKPDDNEVRRNGDLNAQPIAAQPAPAIKPVVEAAQTEPVIVSPLLSPALAAAAAGQKSKK